MSLAEQRRLRIFTLCALYVAQGIPWGFMATTLPGYLTARGVDFGVVAAAMSFTYLPYSFKWVWGPIIDALPLFPRFGRRRAWIVTAQALMAVTVVAMVAFDVTVELKLLAWTIFIHTVFNALQDVAVDALAVDLLDEDERARANGLMFGSKYGGGLIGGYVMAELTFQLGLNTALVIQTAILVAIMMVPLLVRERDTGPRPKRQALSEIVRALALAFSIRSALVTVVLLLGMNFAMGVLSTTGYQLFIGTLKWTYTEYSALTGGWALGVGAVAAAAAGFLVERYGRRRIAAIASIAMAAGWFAFAMLQEHWASRELVWASGLYTQATLATMTVALIAMAMDLSWKKIGGTQFTAYMALSNFSTVLGQQFAVRANELWEFYGVYLAAATVQVAVTALLVFIDPTELRRKLDPADVSGATAAPPAPAANRLGIAAVGVLLVFLIVMTIRASLKYL